jgi:ribosome maturation factor RimP
VSSPGLERPLKRPEHYQRAVGEEIVVKLTPEMAPRRIKGRLLSVGAGPGGGDDQPSISVEATEIDGVELDQPEQRQLSVGDIATARTVFTWGPSPKPGGPRKKKGKKRTSPVQPRGVR